MPRSPSLPEALRQILDRRASEIRVGFPGRVESYDAAKQKCSVQPLIQERVPTEDGTDIVEDLPVLTDVPVAFPRSKDFFVSFPLAKGDLVFLMVSDRSIDKFLAGSGSPADPEDGRMHDISDVVAFPGVYPFDLAVKEADDKKLVIGKDGGVQARFGDEVELGTKGGQLDFVALATNTENRLAALEAIMASHTHIVATTGTAVAQSGTAAPAIIAPPLNTPPADVKATKVKAE